MNAKGEQQKNQMHEEVFIDFTPEGAGKPCAVYCKTYGNLRSGKRPLLVIHGGPGLTHDYLLSIADLASPPHNIPIVFYDQLGCGRSTRLPEKMCDTSFWTLQLYLDELNAVLTGLGIQDDYDILGQSWGGMLAATFAAQQQQPRGLKRLVLSNTCVSTATWMRAYARYRDAMPSPHREILEQPRVFDTPDTPEYDSALAAFYARHVMTMEPFPADYARSWDLLRQDPTVALSTLGPSEFESFGFLVAWSVADEVHNIRVPTLLINGVDEGADDGSQMALQMGIDDVRWVKFANSSHMPHWEERTKYMQVVSEFLYG